MSSKKRVTVFLTLIFLTLCGKQTNAENLEILIKNNPAPYSGVLLPKDTFYELKSAEAERDVLQNKLAEFNASCPPSIAGSGIENSGMMFLVGIVSGLAIGFAVSSFAK